MFNSTPKLTYEMTIVQNMQGNNTTYIPNQYRVFQDWTTMHGRYDMRDQHRETQNKYESGSGIMQRKMGTGLYSTSNAVDFLPLQHKFKTYVLIIAYDHFFF